MPAEIMAKLRAEGLLPDYPKEEEASPRAAGRPSTKLTPRPAVPSAVSSGVRDVPHLHSTTPPTPQVDPKAHRPSSPEEVDRADISVLTFPGPIPQVRLDSADADGASGPLDSPLFPGSSDAALPAANEVQRATGDAAPKRRGLVLGATVVVLVGLALALVMVLFQQHR